jgi:dTDP-4-amino-4,6-dideoxygalactose transaminase
VNLKKNLHSLQEPICSCRGQWYSCAGFSLKALGIGAGDDVIVTSRTFLASASSIVTAGANPIFADVELDSQNISRRTIEAVITPNTKAIICVHLAGWMCDMDPIMQLAEEKGIFVIEDCAQAHGAMYKGQSAGSIGHIGAWSFLPRQDYDHGW